MNLLINMLTVSRIPFTFLFCYFYMYNKNFVWPCLLVFIVIIITDYIDGKIARKYNTLSKIGAWLDVSSDFFFIISSCIMFVSKEIISLWVPIVITIKFIEFLITSYWNKKITQKPKVFLFDPFGRYLAGFFYLLPMIIIIISEMNMEILLPISMIIIILSMISSSIRIWNCLCAIKQDYYF